MSMFRIPRSQCRIACSPSYPTVLHDTTWGQWLVDDQRPFESRTDVLTYTRPSR